jgi:hypothetical protein
VKRDQQVIKYAASVELGRESKKIPIPLVTPALLAYSYWHLFFLESEQLRTRQEYHNRIREATLSRIDILSSNQSAGMSTPSIHDLARKGNYDSFLVGLSLPECVPSMKRIHYF